MTGVSLCLTTTTHLELAEIEDDPEIRENRLREARRLTADAAGALKIRHGAKRG